MAQLKITYVSDEGRETSLVVEDKDGDRKPEITVAGELFSRGYEIGPIEVPVAVPDVMGGIEDALDDMLPDIFKKKE